MAAAGTIRPVSRVPLDAAKRAIVISALDKDEAMEVLKLDVSQQLQAQHPGKIDLNGLARKLRGNSVRFVAMEFPPECSYILPSDCAHVFVTLALVESPTWLACLKGTGPKQFIDVNLSILETYPSYP